MTNVCLCLQNCMKHAEINIACNKLREWDKFQSLLNRMATLFSKIKLRTVLRCRDSRQYWTAGNAARRVSSECWQCAIHLVGDEEFAGHASESGYSDAHGSLPIPAHLEVSPNARQECEETQSEHCNAESPAILTMIDAKTDNHRRCCTVLCGMII